MPVVLYERRGAVAVFTLNRPQARNAVDPEVSRTMNSLMGTFESDPSLRVGVITGAGDAFCSGADLKALAAGRLSEVVDVDPGGFAGFVRYPRRKPFIAAVNGAALAGGFELVLACDLAVASESARFGLPEVRWGIIAGAGGIQRLPTTIPPRRALQLLLTGEQIDAHEALRLGAVNEVVADGQALERALALAETIAGNAPIAVRESLAVARTAIAEGEAAAWRRSTEAWDAVLASEDAGEGPRAFVERREPIWTGR